MFLFPLLKPTRIFPIMQKAQRTMNSFMQKPQGQVSSILKRSDSIDTPKRISPESMTFGSVPLKRLNDFENGDMPEENPKAGYHRSRGWSPSVRFWYGYSCLRYHRSTRTSAR